MKSITVFIMLDACRPDYIKADTTPFLFQLATDGFFSRLSPTFGFEPDAAYLAGLYPDQADQGAQFWHDPAASPFKNLLPARGLHRAGPLLDRLPHLPKKVIRKILTRMAGKKSDSPHLSAVAIPFVLLERFGLPVTVNLDRPGFCNPYPTIFDLLRDQNKDYLFHGAPEYRVSMTAALERSKKELHPPLDFAFFHIGNLDGTGHAFGPDSPEVIRELAGLDRDLNHLYAIARRRFDRVNFVVMGDHGMVRVKRHLNLQADLERLNKTAGLVPGRDYLYMLDSTMARFWFFSSRAASIIRDSLALNARGHILTQPDRDRYHLNYRHNKFGDLIFLVDPEVLIFPNFFQEKNPVKGMHGYAPETPGQQAALIIDAQDAGPVGCNTGPIADMRQVFPTLCDLLSLTRPANCSAESLVMP